MRKMVLWIMVGVLGGALLGTPATAGSGSLQVGAARVDVTPPAHPTTRPRGGTITSASTCGPSSSTMG